MKKWIAIFAVLICCFVYAIVKLSESEYQAMSQGPSPNTPAEETPSVKEIDADNMDEATPEKVLGSPATAAQAEAVAKVFSEFQNAIKSEDYEQAWELTSESFKSQGSFEEFKQGIADKGDVLPTATSHPEAAIDIEGRVGLLVTVPSEEQGMYFFFIQEDGQWKWNDVRPADDVVISDTGSTAEATPEEESGSPATAAEVEAVTKVFSEFQSAVKSGDYEQAWKLTSESFRSKLSFEDFKQGIAAARAEVVEATISLEPVTNIGGRMRLPVTSPSDGDGQMFFVQEDGQWKVDP
ncbi:MAG: hypothetical protein ACYTAS_10480 [Planctomycetota bacterium]|jgi:hypothetical protein